MTQSGGESPQHRSAGAGETMPLDNMVNAVVTETPLRLEPVTDDAFEADGPNEAERAVILARIAALFGSGEPRRAIVD